MILSLYQIKKGAPEGAKVKNYGIFRDEQK